jgi:hypothetical protein
MRGWRLDRGVHVIKAALDVLSEAFSLLKVTDRTVENIAVEIPFGDIHFDPFFVLLHEDERFVHMDY